MKTYILIGLLALFSVFFVRGLLLHWINMSWARSVAIFSAGSDSKLAFKIDWIIAYSTYIGLAGVVVTLSLLLTGV